jgi:hypothetical protein
MRERDVAEVHVKFSAGQAWPKEVNGDVVLLEYGYSAFLHDHKYGFVE